VVTLEDWTDVLYIAIHGSDAYVGYEAMNHTGLAAVSRAQPVAAVLFFVSFVLLGTVVILNLVIGVIISSMEEAQHEREQQLLRDARAQGVAIATAEEIRLLEHELSSLAKRLVEIRHRVEDEAKARPPDRVGDDSAGGG
jgi:voltage-gated sodium channel